MISPPAIRGDFSGPKHLPLMSSPAMPATANCSRFLLSLTSLISLQTGGGQPTGARLILPAAHCCLLFTRGCPQARLRDKRIWGNRFLDLSLSSCKVWCQHKLPATEKTYPPGTVKGQPFPGVLEAVNTRHRGTSTVFYHATAAG